MKKSNRIAAFIDSLPGANSVPGSGDLEAHPSYLGYFQCFNDQLYYEAHDVLEHLWLARRDGDLSERDADDAFFKGLIQLAGAFVHLQKQFQRPDHPKDGTRLRPASRLFNLAVSNIAPYGPVHLHLDILSVTKFCTAQAAAIVESGYSVNPWRPDQAPAFHFGGGPIRLAPR